MTPRGIRNNNWGNIKDSPWSRSQPGYAGSDGTFALYNTPEDGQRAHAALLQSYAGRGLTSPRQIVGRWAPSADGNDVDGYANFIARQLGVGPDDALNFNDPQVVGALSTAMARQENGSAAIDAALKNPGAGITVSPSVGAQAPAPNSGTSSETLLAGTAPAASAQQNPMGGWADSLKGMGAALMSVYDPKGAAVMAGMMDPKEQKVRDQFTAHVDPNTGRGYRINTRTGEVTSFQGHSGKQQQFPPSAMNQLAKETAHWAGTDYVADQAAQIMKDLKSGDLDLGVFNQWLSRGKNLAGVSDTQSRAFARWEQFRNLLANEQLLAAKGVQTEGDAYRAMQQFVAGMGAYDNKTAADSLENVVTKSANEARNRGSIFIQSYQGQYGNDHPALRPYVKQMEDRLKRYDELQEGLKAPVPERTAAQAIEHGFPAGVKTISPVTPPQSDKPTTGFPAGVKSIQPVK